MSYLLDSNACIALLRRRSVGVRKRYEAAVAGGDAIAVSSVVLFELWYGVAKSTQRETNTARLEEFLASPIEVLSFEPEDAREASGIRADLEARGMAIGAYDTLIAGQARRRGLTLVTANAAEFSRVPDLKWEDWGSAPE
ncbi:MAG TPA: type II toxin-antitoxin system VapC family toxin [Chloroflexota bacterium]|nr:type II toxin-antitoxin system VapC family toxin [Chloroflexota bacterium]